MLEVRSVTKKYGKITALDNFSFTLDDGDIVGFIGPNGAGKSTMMKIITGCLAPTEGTALIDGFDIMEDSAAAKERIGYLPEQPPLYPAFTVREYLSTIFDIKRIKANKKERIAEVCELCGLEEMKKRRIGNLSKGYCQRVGMAQAILAYPPLLVLDEPTSGLDPAQKRDMLKLVKKLGKNSGIILSSHILSEIDSVCSKILMINNGKLVSFGAKDELGVQSEKKSRGIVLEYTVAGSRGAALAALSGLDGIKKINVEEKDGRCSMTVLAADDIREGIFGRLSQHGLPILSCSVAGSDLENAFLNMTEGKASAKGRTEGKK